MNTLRWMRVPGDILFAIGAALFAWFVLGLLTGHSYRKGQGQLSGNARKTVDEREEVFAGR
jgi:nitric oxide reductase subunit B